MGSNDHTQMAWFGRARIAWFWLAAAGLVVLNAELARPTAEEMLAQHHIQQELTRDKVIERFLSLCKEQAPPIDDDGRGLTL